jgi:hypothetical protein
MNEDGVGRRSEHALRLGSKGKLDGEGESVWTFIGKVKTRGVGEITLSTTSRAWTGVSEGVEGMDR